MSEAVTGFRDRTRISVSGVMGFSGDGSQAGESTTQNDIGVSGRLSPDLVDGDLIVAPHVGFAWSRVAATRGRRMMVDLKDPHAGWDEPEELSYTVTTKRATADRFVPSAGLSVGWAFEAPHGNGAVGFQAMFEVRRDILPTYDIEQYSDRTITTKASSWGFKAGGEILIEAYRFGEKGDGPGLGLLCGVYWVRGLNPITREGDDHVEVSVGILATY